MGWTPSLRSLGLAGNQLLRGRRWVDSVPRLPSEGIDECIGHTYTLLHHAAEQGQVKAVINLNPDSQPHCQGTRRRVEIVRVETSGAALVTAAWRLDWKLLDDFDCS